MAQRTKTGLVDTYAPPIGLLVKLGSIIVHADELTQPGGHEVDATAIRSLLADREVAAWLASMHGASFLPLRRSGEPYR